MSTTNNLKNISPTFKTALWLQEPVITRKGVHEVLEILDQELEQTPSAQWMKDWTDCLTYLCSCVSCRRRMKKNTLDTRMMDKIFASLLEVVEL
jgi:hypothetical protein